MAGNTASISPTTAPIEASASITKSSDQTKLIFRVGLIALDGIMLLLAFGLAYLVMTSAVDTSSEPPVAFQAYWPVVALQVLTIIIIFYLNQLYHLRRSRSRFDLARAIIGAVTLGTLLASALQEFLFRGTTLEVNYPRTLLVYVWLFSSILTVIGREFYRWLLVRLRKRGIATENLLIIGTDQVARDILGRILKSPELGYQVIGVVSEDAKHKGKMLGTAIIGEYAQIPNLIDQYHIEQVIIALPSAKRSEIVELITLCQRDQVDIKVYPDLFAYMAGDMVVDELGGLPLLTVRDIALRGYKLSLKRGLDLFGSFFGLLFLSPFMLLTALLIRMESKGDVFYPQTRMGLDGRPFPMLKFRSMRQDAETSGPGWTVEDDPRVTRIGRFIRRTNWDEIPQLINVLLGHMSLVGPRPERPVYVQEFQENIPRYMERHREKAGMTGWAQVNGLRGDTSIEDRTRFDLWYVENWSLWLDLKIIFRTVLQTITGRSPNAY